MLSLTDSGDFLYSTSIRKEKNNGDEAHLFSKPIPPINKVCVSFWYKTYGKNVLEVYKVYSPLNDERIWRKNLIKEEDWKHKQILVSGSGIVSYRIYFVAIRTNDTKSTIELDNIRLVYGECEGRFC